MSDFDREPHALATLIKHRAKSTMAALQRAQRRAAALEDAKLGADLADVQRDLQALVDGLASGSVAIVPVDRARPGAGPSVFRAGPYELSGGMSSTMWLQQLIDALRAGDAAQVQQLLPESAPRLSARSGRKSQSRFAHFGKGRM